MICRTHKRLLNLLILAALALSLSGCANRPATPDWQLLAHGSAHKALQAQLTGQQRAAEQEWARAHSAIASSARLDQLARLALLRCAAQVASLEPEGQTCPAFAALHADAQPPEQAYARYLAGQASAADLALLPPAQRQALAAPTQLANIADPFARLVAAGVQLLGPIAHGSAPNPAHAATAAATVHTTIHTAIDTASAQGWRRPLLAWLLLGAKQAERTGHPEQAAQRRRRAQLLSTEPTGHPGTQQEKTP